MSRIKLFVVYLLGFFSAMFIMSIYDKVHATEIQMVQGDYEAPDYSLLAGACSITPKIEALPAVQEVQIETVAAEEPELEPESLGEFRITYYCDCEECCGKWAQYHTTFSGTPLQADHTIAVDPKVIPLGSTVEIYGQEYVAEDTGSQVDGNTIDIYVENHDECYELAAQRGDYTEVYLKEEQSND